MNPFHRRIIVHCLLSDIFKSTELLSHKIDARNSKCLSESKGILHRPPITCQTYQPVRWLSYKSCTLCLIDDNLGISRFIMQHDTWLVSHARIILSQHASVAHWIVLIALEIRQELTQVPPTCPVSNVP